MQDKVRVCVCARAVRDGERPVAEEAVEAEDEVFFVGGDVTTLDGRVKVVHPTEAAALAAAE